MVSGARTTQHYNMDITFSAGEDAGTTSFLDSLLGSLGEKHGLHDNRHLWHNTLTEDLDVSL